MVSEDFFFGLTCSSDCGCSIVDGSKGSPCPLIASSVAASTIPVPSPLTGDTISCPLSDADFGTASCSVDDTSSSLPDKFVFSLMLSPSSDILTGCVVSIINIVFLSDYA